MKKSKIWIVGVAVAVVLLGIIAVIMWHHFSQNSLPDEQIATENQQTIADVRDVLNKTLISSEFLSYLDSGTRTNLEDEFSKVYSESVKIKVSALDEASQTATIEVSAPPLRAIFENSIPTETSGDFDVMFDQYMDAVQDAVSNCAPEAIVTSTVTCCVVGEDNLKIVPNNDLYDAMFPDIQSLLGDILVQMLVDKEG